MDRRTGRALSGFAHVQQSVEVLFSTRIGSRVMRRSVGSNVPQILGRNLRPATLLRFYTAMIAAIEAWEPRLKVKSIRNPVAENTPEAFRAGKVGVKIVADYRPRALEGDFTVENSVSFEI